MINTARSILSGISEAHWAAACLLVVANILERYETISENKYECLCVLEEMYNLAHHVKKLKARPKSREEMEASKQKCNGAHTGRRIHVLHSNGLLKIFQVLVNECEQGWAP